MPYTVRQGTFHETIEVAFTIPPASTLRNLGVAPERKANFELANETIIQRDIGLAIVRISGEEAYTYVIFGDETASPVLGAHALEGLLLAVDPSRKRLVPTSGLMV